jgi:3-oxoacyl-[acyl-carrier protein] reductase
MIRELEGRVALVTGASGGIGAAICRALTGCVGAIAVCYGNGEEAAEALAAELERAGTKARPFAANMADAAAPQRLVASVADALGAPDVLVAAHGVARSSDFETLGADDFDRTLAINLRSPFLLARAAIPHMREIGFGRILFISSTAAYRGGVIGADYASSKAGLHGLTHFLASRVAGDGITVNALAPGYTDTQMLPGNPEELGRRVPVGRVARPEEIGEMALALLSNGFVTNSTYNVDGGVYPR